MNEAAAWTRIAADPHGTTGRELVLRERRSTDESGYGWLEVDVILDGVLVGSFGHGYSPDIELFVAELAEDLREFALDEEVWGGWPICPDHGTHPLETDIVQGTASWRCPTGRVVAPIGLLGASP